MQFKVFARPIARPNSPDYPYEVVTSVNGKEGYPAECRSRRDCLILGNGILSGMRAMANAYFLWSTEDRPKVPANVDLSAIPED